MLRTKFLLAIAGLLLSPPGVRAQFIGYTTSQSTAQNVFVNQAANAISATITNLGQSSHFLSICNNLFAGTIILQSSKDGSFNPPSTVAAANFGQGGPLDSNCHLIQAGGYYRTMRVQLTNYSTGSTNVFYSGIGAPIDFAPPALSTIGPTSPINCDLSRAVRIAQSTTGSTIATGFAGQTIIVCSITLSWVGNVTGGGATSLVSFGAQADSPGTGGGCTAVAVDDTFLLSPDNGANPITNMVGGVGGLFRLPPGQPLCVTIGPIGADTLINVSFAQITF